MNVLWSTREWAEAVAALPGPGPLPCRTVFVPRQRVAHSLRRELLRLGRAEILAGTRFLSPSDAAEEVLRAANTPFASGEEGLRTARVLSLPDSGPGTDGFPSGRAASRLGWDEAIARTIGDLEAAGLRPEDLARAATRDTPRVRSLADCWRRLDEAAGRSWTRDRILLEAARILEGGAGWPLRGETLAALPPHLSAAEARFVRAIPGVRVALLAARPVRTRYLTRLGALLGPEAATAIERSSAPRSGAGERDVLASYLFEAPTTLADSSRPRPGADGTVELEQYAGVDGELEAAARWVGAQILSGVPLEEIAVLLPTLDPFAELLTARLQRLPWPGDGALAVHVAGGLPLRSGPSGVRTLAVLGALEEHLAAERLARVLPALRLEGTDRHLSLGEATELVGTWGAVGGDPAHPVGALSWSRAARERERDLASGIPTGRAEEEEDSVARRRRRLLADVLALRPALDALVEVARLVIDDADLATLWPDLRAFLKLWVRHPGDGPRAHDLIDERLAPLLADDSLGRLSGTDALRLIVRAAEAARVETVRYGEPAVYVGTIREAAGLRFSAVRVLGLCEGHFPSAAREDPVLPDLLRAHLRGIPATATDHVLVDLHALDRVVRDTQRTIVLSAPRTDLQSSQREASSVLLEAAGALGRDGRSVVPDLEGLERDYFASARARLRSRAPRPLSEAAWQDAVADGATGPPPGWVGDALLAPGPLPLPDEAPAPGPLWGLLGGADLRVPGLDAGRPLSPSSLQVLLQCPFRFLLERVVGWSEPASLRSRREIDALSYGTLLHGVAESLYGAHGSDIAIGRGSLADWRARATAMADEAFATFVRSYPLAGEAVRRQERDRLRRDVRRVLEFDWGRAGTWRLIAVERTFGFDEPFSLAAGESALYLRGRIDRVEAEGNTTLVRDLKTGKRKKEEGPTHTIDAQIGIYAMVAARLAETWGASSRVAASYTYVGMQGVGERRFAGRDADRLMAAVQSWLAVASDLLQRRLFPRTSRQEDCAFCPFTIACGEDAYARAEKLLANEPTLQAFRDLKTPIEEEEEE